MYECGILAHPLLVAVVAVDEHQQVCRGEGHLRPFVVARRRAYPTLLVAVDGQSRNVEHAAAYALVGLALAPDAQGQRRAHHLVGIKPADAVAIGYRGEVHQVDERVDLVELLPLEHAAYQLFGRWPIARWILAARLVDAARGGYARQLLQRLRRQLAAEPLFPLMYLVPEFSRVGCVHHLRLNGSAHKLRAHLFYLL